MRLDKSKNDLSVTCAKDGYQTATTVHAPSFGGATFGNIIAGGVIGVVVDAASGANYSYPDDIRLLPAAAEFEAQSARIRPTRISAHARAYPR